MAGPGQICAEGDAWVLRCDGLLLKGAVLTVQRTPSSAETGPDTYRTANAAGRVENTHPTGTVRHACVVSQARGGSRLGGPPPVQRKGEKAARSCGRHPIDV